MDIGFTASHPLDEIKDRAGVVRDDLYGLETGIGRTNEVTKRSGAPYESGSTSWSLSRQRAG